jgi:hypothetical protein
VPFGNIVRESNFRQKRFFSHKRHQYVNAYKKIPFANLKNKAFPHSRSFFDGFEKRLPSF